MKHRPSELGQCWLGAHVHFSLCFPRYNTSRFCISGKFFTNPCMWFFSVPSFFSAENLPPPLSSPRTTSIHAHSALNPIHPCSGRVFGQPEDWYFREVGGFPPGLLPLFPPARSTWWGSGPLQNTPHHGPWARMPHGTVKSQSATQPCRHAAQTVEDTNGTDHGTKERSPMLTLLYGARAVLRTKSHGIVANAAAPRNHPTPGSFVSSDFFPHEDMRKTTYIYFEPILIASPLWNCWWHVWGGGGI